MVRWIIVLLMLSCLPARAQQAITKSDCSVSSAYGVAQGHAPSMDQNGNLCVTGQTAAVTLGNGSLGATTTSALIKTMTANSAGAAFPANIAALTVLNVGANDAAFCKNTSSAGATCTCPSNGVAASNGVMLPASGGYAFNLGGLSQNNPTIVACTGTTTLQFQW